MLTISDQYYALDFFYRSFAYDPTVAVGMNLIGTFLSKNDPLKIYDLKGKLLFYDFKITDSSDNNHGFVRSSAMGAELPLIDSINIGTANFDPEKSIALAVKLANDEYAESQIAAKQFVCYGYPRIGVLVSVKRNNDDFFIVYDAITGSRITEFEGEFIESDAGDIEKNEGMPLYSYIDRFITEAGTEPAFNAEWKNVEKLIECNNAFFNDLSLERRLLPVMRGVSLPIPVVGQETDVFCAVATAKMALDFLGFTGLSQEEIAQKMNTGVTGTSNFGQRKGYEKLTENQWTAQEDNSPTYEEALNHLNSFLPIKSGIPRHARLLRGCREYIYLEPKTLNVLFRKQFYLINDPSPVNQGQYTIEGIDKPGNDFYKNFLLIKKKATA
jgi:hypothetical protein